MEVIGLICEFNPLHNGHLYFIKEIKKKYPDSLLVVILSGNYTERGDFSILPKSEKVKTALEAGIDVVLELPSIFVTNSADYYAEYAVKALNNAQVNHIIWGSELGDVEVLKEYAKKISSKESQTLIKKNLKEGMSYAESCFSLLNTTLNSNDILGISYIKAIEKINPSIKFSTIKRTNSFNDLESNNDIISANNIRNKLLNKEKIDNYIPSYVVNKLLQVNSLKAFEFLKYKVLTSPNLDIYLGSEEGLSIRVYNKIRASHNVDELINLVSSKRFSKHRVKRFLIHILLGFKKEDLKFPKYTRVLGFNQNGQNYLRRIKTDKLIYKVNDNTRKTEITSAYVYDLIMGSKELEFELSNKPIIKKSNL